MNKREKTTRKGRNVWRRHFRCDPVRSRVRVRSSVPVRRRVRGHRGSLSVVVLSIAVGAAIPVAGANNWHQSPVHVLQRLGEPTSRALAEEARDLTQKTGGGDLGGDDRRRRAEPHWGRLVKHHGERRP